MKAQASVFAVVSLCVALAFSTASASDLPNGFVTPAGYTHLNGYFWKGDQAYVRRWVHPHGYSNGWYQYDYAVIAPVVVVAPPQQLQQPAPAPLPVAPPVSVANELQAALGKLAAVKQQVAEAEGVLRGAAGQPQYQGGTGYAGPGGPASLQLSTAGVNANTVYGYGQSFNSIASFYGDTNPMQLLQMVNRGWENTLKAADQAGKMTVELTAQQIAARDQHARGLVAIEMMKAIYPPQTTIETKSSSWKSEPPPMPSVDPPQAQLEPNALKQAWAGHAAKACGACHGGGKQEGGFALASFPTMDAAAKAAVRARLDHPQEKRRMPKDSPKLAAAERKLWDW